MTEWIEWNGGEQPVPDDTCVEVRYRDGEKDCGGAWFYDWWHDTGCQLTDIIAYRVLEDA